MDQFDVPELIAALAERFSDHGIAPQEARHITLEMLAEAFDDLSEFEDGTLVADHFFYIPTRSTIH